MLPILLDLIDLSKLRRAIVYGLMLAVLFVVQELLLRPVTFLGVRAMVVPAAVIGVGLFEGGLWGGLFGLAAGYFGDMGYTEQVVLFTVLFPTFGFFAGVLGKYMLHKGFVSYMVLVLLALSITALCQMFHFLFFVTTNNWAVLRTGILQILWSLAWAVPVYFPCKRIAARPMGR